MKRDCTSTLRILFALIAYFDLEAKQFNIITAYLNAHLSNNDIVLLCLPPSCPCARIIVRLRRGMYSLCQLALL
jgi:hypothetical protein